MATDRKIVPWYEMYDEKLIEKYQKLLDSKVKEGQKKELIVQEFLEKNSELIPTPYLLNHRLHFNIIISKLRLDTSLICDYAFLTKSSRDWHFVLVEFENPDTPLFQKSKDNRTKFSGGLQTGLQQILSWQTFIKQNEDEVIRKVRPLLKPITMSNNPIYIKYALIAGRSNEYEKSEARRKVLSNYCNKNDIEFFSFDSLIKGYESGWNHKKNIISSKKQGFKFKYIDGELDQTLAYLNPDEISFTKKQLEKLSDNNYDMDSWIQGHSLNMNGKSRFNP